MHFAISIFRFLVPSTLVICNDVAAYFVGSLCGKHRLITVSPKKTLEGFVGGVVATIIYGYFVTTYLSNVRYLTRSLEKYEDLWQSWWEFQRISSSGQSLKQINSIFTQATTIRIPILDLESTVPLVQLHAFVLAVFASLIAPFGGFFASGFKRAFKVKDFAESLPGHGGITDRMDCQFLMAIFSFLYYQSLIKRESCVDSIMEIISSNFDHEQQLELHRRLTDLLKHIQT